MPEIKENAPIELTWAHGAQPSTEEQIIYMNDCLASAEEDLSAIDAEAEIDPEFKEYSYRMQGLVNMLKAIKMNLLACLKFEQAGKPLEKEVSNG